MGAVLASTLLSAGCAALAGLDGDVSFGSVSNAIPATIGHPNHVMTGRVNEVRVYSEALSATWIDAEYRNLAQPTSLYTVGPTETAN